MSQYSIVFPAYNESERITASLDQVLKHISAERWDAEVIVVNDGSRDNTADIVRRYAAQHPIVSLIENPGNRGKGYSVRNGMLNARGDILLFSDADLASSISEASKLLDAIAAGADVAIGSRWLRPELQTERQSPMRQLFGRIYNLLLRIVLGLKYCDTQCGFKAFTRKAARTIFSTQHVERWGFDAEVLFLARHFGFKVTEVAIAWAHADDSKLNPVRDGMRMFREMLSIRWNAIMGRYALPPVARPAAESE